MISMARSRCYTPVNIAGMNRGITLHQKAYVMFVLQQGVSLILHCIYIYVCLCSVCISGSSILGFCELDTTMEVQYNTSLYYWCCFFELSVYTHFWSTSVGFLPCCNSSYNQLLPLPIILRVINKNNVCATYTIWPQHWLYISDIGTH